ncbi:c-type cytochrome [Maribacter polysaccharolyticus]|uniref:c-type cytochrome n=1 Tax=Maribacter polysaccharolyticus TaxID=3020831 RepID=UPI00237F224F|nr:c-type cytochrome [Maribacter polysaccharolyticus]MDE3741426.1 c-type cytochrome [Maribacter polysaccharolyticus]
MKSTVYGVLVSLIMLVTACGEKKPTEAVAEEIPKLETDIVEHGEYLVNILGCTDCHTPKKMTEQGPVPDMDKYLMGFDASRPLPPIPENVPLGPWILFSGELTAAVGPWGTSYSGNLTPHETGIGTWSLEQFKKALREAKFKGLDNSRPIMPPMPQHYAYLTDEDIEAVFEYLKTIPPIENRVPAYEPPTS